MKRFFLTIALLTLFTTAYSQDYYRTAFGFRGGLDYGLTAKHFISHTETIEGIFSMRWQGFMITGLYERNSIAFNTPGLNWYIGGGAHIGFWNSYYDNYWWDRESHPGKYTVFGADFILGLEYTFEYFPINLSIDWKPAINFFGYTGMWADFAALSIRYAIF